MSMSEYWTEEKILEEIDYIDNNINTCDKNLDPGFYDYLIKRKNYMLASLENLDEIENNDLV